MIKYIDQNGDGVINDQDKVVLGQALPNVMGGFTNTFNYKNWSLTVFFNYALGGKIINTNVTKLDLYQAGNNNSYADGLGAWRPANPITGDQGWMDGSKPLPSSEQLALHGAPLHPERHRPLDRRRLVPASENALAHLHRAGEDLPGKSACSV